ncbi:MAG TPA: hypothetical protein VGR96_13355 [Acidobacteriaceae bacterium]|nr:hypothetical protein [Acidobacteriaceae bacterium]
MPTRLVRETKEIGAGEPGLHQLQMRVQALERLVVELLAKNQHLREALEQRT